MRVLLLPVLLMMSLSASSVAAAGYGEKPPKDNIPRAQGPFFDPVSQNYFELRIDNRGIHDGVEKSNWLIARSNASTKFYEGRRGRLAIVRDQRILEFIRERFQVNEPAWIGARFFCKFRKLLWVDGDVQELGKAKLWHRVWYTSKDIRCSNQDIEYMPLMLTGHLQGGIYWKASGPEKFFVSYFVEYPKPSDETKGPVSENQ